MNNPSTMIKSITEKLEFLNSMEKLYQRVQEMLHYLGIKPPSKLNFNHYLELIKQRKQDLAFARWTIQRQYREWFTSHMSKTGLIKMYKKKEETVVAIGSYLPESLRANTAVMATTLCFL